MNFIRVPTKGIKPLIKVAFKDDPQLLLSYHILNGTLEECVNDTYDKIIEFSDMANVQSYAILVDDKTIGFTVVSKDMALLYSFGINVAYRRYNHLENWFKNIVSKMPCFKCYLWNKNSRAIEFLVKCGMEKTEVTTDYTLLNYAVKS